MTASCPLPIGRYPEVLLGHGGGGRLGAELLREVIFAGLGDRGPDGLEDQAILDVGGARIAMTTDAFVVHPRFFPGGDVGSLAVYGTVNDLAVGGAIPRWLSAALILEEGLPMEELARVMASMRAACERCDVRLVTGDTKVVDRGMGDGVFVTTTGVGVVPEGRALSAKNARPGDAILLSGTVGDHGVAVMSVREGLAFEAPIESDCGPIAALCEALLAAAPNTRAMRDPTRGGLATTLLEIAGASKVGVELVEASVPIGDAVRGACELLGLDPLFVANEGKLVAVVPSEEADAGLAALRALPEGRDAAIVGRVTEGPPGRAVLETPLGTRRTLMLARGEALPRIC